MAEVEASSALTASEGSGVTTTDAQAVLLNNTSANKAARFMVKALVEGAVWAVAKHTAKCAAWAASY